MHNLRKRTGKDSTKRARLSLLASIGLLILALSSARQAYGNVIMTGLPTTTILLTEGQKQSFTLTITNSTGATVFGGFSAGLPSYLNGDRSDLVSAQIKNNSCSSSLENVRVGLAAGASCTFQLSLLTPARRGTGESGTDADSGFWRVDPVGRAASRRGEGSYIFGNATTVQVQDDPPPTAAEPDTPTLVLLVMGPLGLVALRKNRLAAKDT